MSKSLYTTFVEEIAPTTSTEGVVGQLYLDTVAKKLYQCVAITTDGTAGTTSYEWQGVGGGSGVSQEDFDKLVNNTTQIVDANGGFYAGGSYKGNKGIAIGQISSVSGNYGTAIGYNAKAGSYGVALGSSVASQTLATTRAIQLGEGLNYTEKSLQVFNDNIYKADTHTLTVQNIELNGVNLGTQLGDLNTALEAILGV